MGGLFGGAPKAPKPAAPVRMPDIASPVVNAAEEEARRKAMSRSGRASTILSQGSSGGSQAYTNTALGQS